jgi:hypothetical protein
MLALPHGDRSLYDYFSHESCQSKGGRTKRVPRDRRTSRTSMFTADADLGRRLCLDVLRGSPGDAERTRGAMSPYPNRRESLRVPRDC